ncbi:MAG: N-acetylglucosamine-6-phosphate deacetylase [Oscillospiraceae bacterium]|nr:N-acetylglucosamine-6-phosphate deacetylase [Oscillospiraceae bacterium]
MAKVKVGAVVGDRIFTADRAFRPGTVWVEGGLISKVAYGEEGWAGLLGAEGTLDVRGYTLSPGFVDIHTHGCLGFQYDGADERSLAEIESFMPGKGVTTLLPTVVPAPPGKMASAIAGLAKYIRGSAYGVMKGINVEGPFVNPDYKGALPKEHLLSPSREVMKDIVASGGGLVRLMTVAPELPGAYGLIEEFGRGEGKVRFSIGHTSCAYDGAMGAFASGIAHSTHLFNAMRGIHHREPGLAGAVLDCGECTAEIIGDGVHIHPAIVRLTVGRKGAEMVAMVSDSVSHAFTEGKGAPDGMVIGEAAYLPSGVLAGSVVSLGEILKNLIGWGFAAEDALTMLSATPAKAAGLVGVGSICEGMAADMVALDAGMRAAVTMVGGAVLHDAR